ncbi:MAG: VOC family protein [Cyanobacteria bacterium P01_F01_bin.150]
MNILRPLHTAMLISDLSASRHFYSVVLRLPEVERPLSFPGLWYQLGNYQIHLIVDKSAPNGLHNSDKWGRNHHLAFAIADLESAKAHINVHGWEVQESASGRPAIFLQDPDGNVIELLQS